jgi:hypothetical protein
VQAIVCENRKKGRSTYVEGRQNNRKWRDREGKDFHTTDAADTEIQMLGNRQRRALKLDNMDDDLPLCRCAAIRNRQIRVENIQKTAADFCCVRDRRLDRTAPCSTHSCRCVPCTVAAGTEWILASRRLG